MDVATTRFGQLNIDAKDVIRFPAGLIGMEDCRCWVLLADAENDALGWLQSVERPEVALAVVSPRRFVPGYQIRVVRRDLAPLELSGVEDARVLVIVGKTERGNSLNLKAPLIFNLHQQLAAQVIAKDEHPLRYDLPSPHPPLKKSA